jgi:hypothetical protein
LLTPASALAAPGNPSNLELGSPVSAWDSPWVTFSASAQPDPGVTVSYVKYYVDLPLSQRTSPNPSPRYSCDQGGDPTCQFVGLDRDLPFVLGAPLSASLGTHTATAQAWRYVWGDAQPVFMGQSSKTFTRTPPGPSVPTRAAFYDTSFPEGWTRPGGQVPATPFSKWTPSSGLYDSGDPSAVSSHVAEMKYGGIASAIAYWWGCSKGPGDDASLCPANVTTEPSHKEASRVPTLLESPATGEPRGSQFHWALAYEPEWTQDPTVDRIKADLAYIASSYASHPSYWREVYHRPVVFVHNADDLTTAEGCATVARWVQATDELGGEGHPQFWIALEAFPGFDTCAVDRSGMPEAWHEREPALAYQGGAAAPATAGVYGSISISPGFDRADDTSPGRPFLRRDLHRWRQNVRDMLASGSRYHLVTTFNGWSDGTAVEPAHEWTSPVRAGQSESFGQFLDALRDDGEPAGDPVIAAAGDISREETGCVTSGSSCHAGPTADGIIASVRPDLVLTLGDNQYETGQLAHFNAGYQTTWGRFRGYTLPAAGNHEGGDAAGNYEGYFDYFGNGGFATPDVANGAAGARGQGYYSYDVGPWHLVALNSDLSSTASPAQLTWLQNDLLAQPADRCILAFFHHPLFTDGPHGENENGRLDDLWNVLYPEGVDVVLNGHDHNYQRFAPRTPAGVADPTGILQFVVGTGGKNRTSPTSRNNASVKSGTTFGVLKMTLHAGSYDFAFVRDTHATNGTFTDSGSGLDCANDGHLAGAAAGLSKRVRRPSRKHRTHAPAP